MPDLDLILQAEQVDAEVRLSRQVNLSLPYNSGVPTAPQHSRRVDRDEDRIGSLDRRRAFSRKSQPSRGRSAATNPSRSGSEIGISPRRR
jgi:hypothetical protein